MTQHIKIYDAHFVGIDNTRVNAAPLAFMTPHEDNAAGEKRQTTVKEWLYGYSHDASRGLTDKMTKDKELKTVPNRAQAGFRIVDAVSRATNKVARIVDPNGFEVEISIANLIDLLLAAIVDKGEIKCECIWVRMGSQNWLLRSDDPRVVESRQAAKTAVKAKRVRVNHKIGDVIENAYGHYLYIGQFDVQYVIATGKIKTRRAWGEKAPSKISAAGIGAGRMHVYMCRKYASDGSYSYHDGIDLRKTKMTARQIVDQDLEAGPVVDDQKYFTVDFYSTMTYDESQTLYKNDIKGATLGKGRWETSVVRLAVDGFLHEVNPRHIPFNKAFIW